MKSEKKIELQAKMIRELQIKVQELAQENAELKFKIQEDEKLVTEAETYTEIHNQCVQSLNEAKEKYYAALSELQKERSKYQKEMKRFFHGMKKIGLTNTDK